jgi:hypothetical protein
MATLLTWIQKPRTKAVCNAVARRSLQPYCEGGRALAIFTQAQWDAHHAMERTFRVA